MRKLGRNLKFNIKNLRRTLKKLNLIYKCITSCITLWLLTFLNNIEIRLIISAYTNLAGSQADCALNKNKEVNWNTKFNNGFKDWIKEDLESSDKDEEEDNKSKNKKGLIKENNNDHIINDMVNTKK